MDRDLVPPCRSHCYLNEKLHRHGKREQEFNSERKDTLGALWERAPKFCWVPQVQ
uniref:MIP33503p1 n=1 Tax=Drosophila melanogaster TaxID=7227 RepID=H1UUA8_DROME|nr:MIP33503p1 [Drosophila melanogaster]